MGLKHELAAHRAWKAGVVHTTLNPEGPGCVRIHLIPPKWKPFAHNPYVMILNGYYILPLGYSWAILLGCFIREVNQYEGRPMTMDDMEQVMKTAVDDTRKVYSAPRQQIADDLREMLTMFYDVARGHAPDADIPAMSLRSYAAHMSAPHRMDLMISSMVSENGQWNCCLKCRHCYAAGQPAASVKELATRQWKTVIDKCKDAGIPQLTFTGGEPTMRDDLVELVEYSRWFVTRLNTNGCRLTKDLCGQLREASLDSVQITLYSFDPAIHNSLVGASLPHTDGGWEQTVTGLRNALEAGLNVSVNTPLCRDNEDYLSTLHFLLEEGVRYVTCSGLIETGNASSQGSLSSQLSLDEMGIILTSSAKFCKGTGMELSFTSPGRADTALLRELNLSVPMCGACLSNMAVAPDGTVVPCQSWLGEGFSLGNLLTTPWKQIWNQETCQSIRSMSEEDALLCPLRTERFQKGGNA
ncbi:MAG: radical SAM protein [Hungatella hathewayi]|nr:radical SAM protein [Hungatella hathewayi]